MRRNISLYIADQKVDLSDQSFILFNYTMEDLSNPTIVKNSFSKQITLPGTPNNNKIFGEIWKLDRVTQYGEGFTGVEFDPMRKTPFTIYNEMNEILESGYIKLDKVSRKGDLVEYSISAYGGLGSFFYNLMYHEDGNKKTLADLRFMTLNGVYSKAVGHLGLVGGYDMLHDAWSYLADPDNYDVDRVDNWWANIINFAPCYNGLPADFSADKALVDNNSFDNVPYAQVVDGKAYTFKEGTSSNLMLFTNPHNEWEMRDLRWYLQRPVFSIKALFDAICDQENNGGYEVILDSSFFAKSNNLYWNGWITLPLIAAADRKNPDAIRNLLASTLSPADYIISFAKIFGLVFFFNKQRQITIMPKKAFYDETSMIDLTGRVNVADISLSSVLAQSRFYQYGGGTEPKEEWAASYYDTYGENYGIQLINTGNEFNNDKTIITKDIVFKEAVEVQERSLLFTSYDMGRDDVIGGEVDRFNLCDFEGVNVQLWRKDESGNDAMVEIPITIPYQGFLYPINPVYPLSDWLPKMQFHDKDNKATDGANALVVFNGMKDTTRWESWAKLFYWLTDDCDDMETLNQGQPCWNFSKVNSKKIERLPSFRSCTTYDVDGDDVISETYEYGVPKARGVNGVFHNSEEAQTIYNRYWKNYIKDRYDDDTFSMTCKVNLQGFLVGQELMRSFFYFQGSVFVLNKITNHSLSTFDDTECEFIRVQEISNYKS